MTTKVIDEQPIEEVERKVRFNIPQESIEDEIEENEEDKDIDLEELYMENENDEEELEETTDSTSYTTDLLQIVFRQR